MSIIQTKFNLNANANANAKILSYIDVLKRKKPIDESAAFIVAGGVEGMQKQPEPSTREIFSCQVPS
ncbi:MAG: hypothetical protein ACI9DQ_001380 [Glaciecola sp.]